MKQQWMKQYKGAHLHVILNKYYISKG